MKINNLNTNKNSNKPMFFVSDIERKDSKSTAVVVREISEETTVEKFKRILKDHPDYNFSGKTRFGKSTLHHVAACGNEKLLRYIVKKGGKGLLDLVDSIDHTVLFEAIVNKQFGITKTLVELGADINKEVNKRSPLRIALQAKDLKIALLLKAKGGKVSPPLTPEEQSEMTLMKQAEEILKGGPSTFKKYQNSNSPLSQLPQDLVREIAALYFTTFCEQNV